MRVVATVKYSFKKYWIFRFCQGVESFSPFLWFFQMGMKWPLLPTPHWQSPGGKATVPFTSLSMWTQMFANPWEEGGKKCHGRVFTTFQRELQHLPSHTLFCNIILAPSQQEVEPTWFSRPVEDSRSEVGPTLTCPDSFCFLPLRTPMLDMTPPRTSPVCCEKPSHIEKPCTDTLVDTSPDCQPCEGVSLDLQSTQAFWCLQPQPPSDCNYRSSPMWEPPNWAHSTKTWDRMNCCFKPLNFGDVF